MPGGGDGVTGLIPPSIPAVVVVVVCQFNVVAVAVLVVLVAVLVVLGSVLIVAGNVKQIRHPECPCDARPARPHCHLTTGMVSI